MPAASSTRRTRTTGWSFPRIHRAPSRGSGSVASGRVARCSAPRTASPRTTSTQTLRLAATSASPRSTRGPSTGSPSRSASRSSTPAGSAAVRRRPGNARPAPTASAAPGLPSRWPNGGKATRGRRLARTRTSCPRCRPAASPESTTPISTSSSTGTPRTSRLGRSLEVAADLGGDLVDLLLGLAKRGLGPGRPLGGLALAPGRLDVRPRRPPRSPEPAHHATSSFCAAVRPWHPATRARPFHSGRGGRVLTDVVAQARHPVDQALALEDAHGLADRLAGVTVLAAQNRDRREPAARSERPAGDLVPDERGQAHVGARVWLGGCRHVPGWYTMSIESSRLLTDNHE